MRSGIAGVVLCIATVAGVVVGCGATPSDDTSGGADSSAPVTFAPGEDDGFFLFPEPVARDGLRPADIAVDWMEREIDLIQREQLSAPVATRVLAYTSLALDTAVALVVADEEPLDIDGLVLPERPAGPLDAGVAGTVATAEVTRNLVPTADGQRQSELLVQQHLERIASQTDMDLGPSIRLGEQVAGAVLAMAGVDGYDIIATDVPNFEARPGTWQPTAPEYRLASEPEWGDLRPLVVSDADCPVPDPIAFSEVPGSPFWEQVVAPYEASNSVTDEQRDIVRHWSDQVGLTFTPAGHWVHILAAEIDADGTSGSVSLDQAARQFALLSLVQADTFIATWKVKYRVMLERPVTYVQRLIDPEWLPFLTTPPHPEYPSGHSAGSTAAATVLATMLGERSFTDTTHDRIGWEPRSFASFTDAADEASKSRLYGGIHYPMASEAGVAQGRCMATTALVRLGITGPGR